MNDVVNHPSHYAEGRKFEPIVVFANWDAGFNIGNALKYISRAGRKSIAPPVEDLKKATFYLNYEVSFREQNPDSYFKAIEDNRICPIEVAEDWGLDENLTSAVCSCFESLRSTKVEDRIKFLKIAAENVASEIEYVKQMETKSAIEFKENIK